MELLVLTFFGMVACGGTDGPGNPGDSCSTNQDCGQEAVCLASRGVSAHLGVLGGVGAALSAVMNNVAALALLMPVDLEAARGAEAPTRKALQR